MEPNLEPPEPTNEEMWAADKISDTYEPVTSDARWAVEIFDMLNACGKMGMASWAFDHLSGVLNPKLKALQHLEDYTVDDFVPPKLDGKRIRTLLEQEKEILDMVEEKLIDDYNSRGRKPE